MRIASLALMAGLCACGGKSDEAETTTSVMTDDTSIVINETSAPVDEIAPEPQMAAIPSLSPRWQVTEGLAQPEGVARARDGSLFISNVAGSDTAVDGNGWITKLSPDGEVVAARWTEGLNAPKGMVAHDGVLYVADINTVRLFDLETGGTFTEITVEGSEDLNDMTVWRGTVFVSDSKLDRVYQVTDNGALIWAEGESIDGVVGILGDGHRMLLTTEANGDLIEATSPGEFTILASGMKNAHGLGHVPGGGYMVSSDPGEIFFISDDGEIVSLLNTRADNIQQNDLSVFGDLVVVPNKEPGTVTAWSIVR